MNFSKSTIIITLVVSFLFFLAGRFFYRPIFSFFEPEIKGITFEIISADRRLKTSMLFSIIAAFIPLVTVFAWTCLSISAFKRLISGIIILLCISFAIFARDMAVKHYFNSLVSKLLASKNTQHFLYPIDPRNFVYKIMMGYGAGILISCLLFFKKKLIIKSNSA